VEKNKTIS